MTYLLFLRLVKNCRFTSHLIKLNQCLSSSQFVISVSFWIQMGEHQTLILWLWMSWLRHILKMNLVVVEITVNLNHYSYVQVTLTGELGVHLLQTPVESLKHKIEFFYILSFLLWNHFHRILLLQIDGQSNALERHKNVLSPGQINILMEIIHFIKSSINSFYFRLFVFIFLTRVQKILLLLWRRWRWLQFVNENTSDVITTILTFGSEDNSSIILSLVMCPEIEVEEIASYIVTISVMRESHLDVRVLWHKCLYADLFSLWHCSFRC